MDMDAIIAAASSVWDGVSLILEICGAISFVLLALGAFTRVGKALVRFGLALHAKKIMVVADAADYSDIKEDLCDSGLIKKENIQLISDKHLAKAKETLLLVVVYGYLDESAFESVVKGKDARCGLIVYCPPEKGRIREDEMQLLSKTNFTALCNFRGRLVNDVLLMMLSTSFIRADIK